MCDTIRYASFAACPTLYFQYIRALLTTHRRYSLSIRWIYLNEIVLRSHSIQSTFNSAISVLCNTAFKSSTHRKIYYNFVYCFVRSDQLLCVNFLFTSLIQRKYSKKMADSASKRNIPIKMGDFSVIDTEFASIRERFDP